MGKRVPKWRGELKAVEFELESADGQPLAVTGHYYARPSYREQAVAMRFYDPIKKRFDPLGVPAVICARLLNADGSGFTVQGKALREADIMDDWPPPAIDKVFDAMGFGVEADDDDQGDAGAKKKPPALRKV